MDSKITEEQISVIASELKQGKKLAAIKFYRDWTGSSLLEAKIAVEDLARQHIDNPLVFDEELDEQVINQVLEALHKRNKLLAVKIYKESRSVSLLEAKTFIEQLMRELNIEDKPGPGCAGAVLAVVLLIVGVSQIL